ncbi:uncharacterized protein LOC143100113 isoform X2 [Alosa pseudoharengus]|uniref:uncharacterized protein LOC143100113 isoform X2 n=1 Tax=Alosa pseudoharengus TaxID=34774 RepID=UPI003F8C0251
MWVLPWMMWGLMSCSSLSLDMEEHSLDEYSLEFQHTVQRGPDDVLHFHQTTVFKGEVIFYCNSTTLTDQPKQQWILESFSPDERHIQDEFCRGQYYEHMQWFREINQTIDGTTEILQRRSGCKANGSGVFAFDKWAVNGEDFLTVNHEALRWIPASELAVSVALEWNKQDVSNIIRKLAYRDFGQSVCEKSQKFKHQIQTWSKKTDKRDMDIHVFLKNTNPSQTSGFLTCHVIDSDLSGVRIQLTKDGVPLDYGVKLFGPRPNEDGTVQMRVQVLISLKDTKGFRCKVQSESFNFAVLWDGLSDKINHFPVNVNTVGICVVVCLGLVVLIIKYRKYLADRLHRDRRPTSSSEPQNNEYLLYVGTQEQFEEWAAEDDKYYRLYVYLHNRTNK